MAGALLSTALVSCAAVLVALGALLAVPGAEAGLIIDPKAPVSDDSLSRCGTGIARVSALSVAWTTVRAQQPRNIGGSSLYWQYNYTHVPSHSVVVGVGMVPPAVDDGKTGKSLGVFMISCDLETVNDTETGAMIKQCKSGTWRRRTTECPITTNSGSVSAYAKEDDSVRSPAIVAVYSNPRDYTYRNNSNYFNSDIKMIFDTDSACTTLITHKRAFGDCAATTLTNIPSWLSSFMPDYVKLATVCDQALVYGDAFDHLFYTQLANQVNNTDKYGRPVAVEFSPWANAVAYMFTKSLWVSLLTPEGFVGKHSVIEFDSKDSTTLLDIKFFNSTCLVICAVTEDGYVLKLGHLVPQTSQLNLTATYTTLLVWTDPHVPPAGHTCSIAALSGAEGSTVTDPNGIGGKFVVVATGGSVVHFFDFTTPTGGLGYTQLDVDLGVANYTRHSLAILRVNSTHNKLLVGSNTTDDLTDGFTNFWIRENVCSDWDGHRDRCKQFKCNYCGGGACREKCPECATITNSTACVEESCLYCTETQTCQSTTCLPCTAYTADTCNTPGCTWCGASSMCVAKSTYCYYCAGASQSEAACEAGGKCQFCQSTGTCTSGGSCIVCGSLLAEIACNSVEYCGWCASTKSCGMASTLQCPLCMNISSQGACGDSTQHPGCAWDNETHSCGGHCAVDAAENATYFASGFVEPTSGFKTTLAGGEIVDLVVDKAGYTYACGMNDGPFVAKIAPNGNVVGYDTFDSSTGTVESISLDPNGQIFYVVGAGRFTPLEIQNAPSGVVVSLVPNSQDAALMAYSTKNMTRLWSVRWGSSSSRETFTSLKFLYNGYRVLSATVQKDFPTSMPSGVDCGVPVTTLEDSTFGLLIFFDASEEWNRISCYFASTGVSSSLVDVATASTSNDVAAVGTVLWGSGYRDCVLTYCSLSAWETFSCGYKVFGELKEDDSCASVALQTDAYSQKRVYGLGELTTDYVSEHLTGLPCNKTNSYLYQWTWRNDTSSTVSYSFVCPPSPYTTMNLTDMAPDAYYASQFHVVGRVANTANSSDTFVVMGTVTSSSRIVEHSAVVPTAGSYLTCIWLSAYNMLYTGGATKQSSFVSTTKQAPIANVYNPIFIKVAVEEYSPCMPTFPSRPLLELANATRTAADADLTKRASVTDVSVYWPSFTLFWQQSRFGVAGKDYNNSFYLVRYWQSSVDFNNITEIKINNPEATSHPVLLEFNNTAWCWNVTACNGLSACTSAQTQCFSYNFTSPGWFDDLVEKNGKQYTLGTFRTAEQDLQCDFTAGYPNPKVGSSYLRCGPPIGVDYNPTKITLKFTTNYYVLDTKQNWIVFYVRALLNASQVTWTDGPLVLLTDAKNGTQQYTLQGRALLPNTAESYWWYLGVPITDDAIANDPIGWQIERNNFNPHLLQSITIVASANAKIAYFDIDGITQKEAFAPSYDVGNDGKKSTITIIIAVAVPVAATLFVGVLLITCIVFLAVWATHRMRQKQQNAMVNFGNMCALNTETFNFPDSQLVDLEEFPLKFSVDRLTFGYDTDHAPIDQVLEQAFTVTNAGESRVTFKFFPPNNAKFTLQFDPMEHKLSPGTELEVKAAIRLTCTTCLYAEIPVAICAGSKWNDAPAAHTELPVSLESELSSKVDPDEVKLMMPPIGEGGFAIVYRGMWREQTVAVKVVKNQDVEGDYEDFMNEVKMMENLRSPQVVRFVGASLIGRLSILTEYLELGNLRSCIIKKNKFSDNLKVKCMLDIARGMCFLHSSAILHRDIKPDNILMASFDVRAQACAKITDFGTTRNINNSDKTQYYTKGVGTPVYMAPEILQSDKYSTSADVYSFALLMLFLLTEKEPYSEDKQFANAWQISEYVISKKRLPIPRCSLTYRTKVPELIRECWAPEPHYRPSFSAIADRLDAEFQALDSN
eukprot:TRINITY_DN2538_c0_g1_i2.p1 TRINITY_DN2538_c0_g1~~TRINITY_DN2538_c0_g1_i2.p1  ORF type:complete len:1913 (+),score=474.61 TRINITY_DN2538_c0_g1_i2:119-5857(+)